MSGPTPLLPLFPLPNVVHFPGTLLPLHVFEPRYRRMIEDLLAMPEPERLLGMVLLGIEADDPGEERIRLVLPGTAGRLVGVEPLADGRFDILLHGEYRFEIAEEVFGRPYRRARVIPLVEVPLSDEALRRRLTADLAAVASETGEAFPLAASEVAGLLADAGLSELVNRLAAELDLPVARRQALLAADLPERAESIASVLGSRRRLLGALRPYRHLAARAATN